MIDPEKVGSYLSGLFGKPVRILSLQPFEKGAPSEDLKGFGYGIPLRIHFAVNGVEKVAVLGTMTPNPFGHDHFSDRAQTLLWEHDTFRRLPRHVRSLDVGTFTKTGHLISLGEAEEFFILTEFSPGEGYYRDLERLVPEGRETGLDLARAGVLADYLAAIHRVKNPDAPSLYIRRIRDLIGHGECLMGIIDNYPREFGFITQDLLQRVEERMVSWRWRLKPMTYRLSQVHGDFHPWNILFREGTDFTVLDRSRGEWGEPADDIGSLSVNYLFCSLRRYGRLDGPFESLFRTFWETYLRGTGDEEILRVIPPFLAWRALVVASPVWYPTIPIEIRRKLFALIRNVLEMERFDPARVNDLLSEGK